MSCHTAIHVRLCYEFNSETRLSVCLSVCITGYTEIMGRSMYLVCTECRAIMDLKRISHFLRHFIPISIDIKQTI